MSDIRKNLAVISFAVPLKAKDYLDERVKVEGFFHRSDFLRKLLLDYLKCHIPQRIWQKFWQKLKKWRKADYDAGFYR